MKKLFLLCTALFTLPLLSQAATSPIILPTAAGTYNEWTPKSGTTHYTAVDETPCNGTTDYVATSTIGKRDSYTVALSAIPNNALITAIAIAPCASRATTGTGSSVLNVFYRYNGTNGSNLGSYAPSGTTPSALATSTWSGLSLVKTSTSTLEIGMVYTSGTKGGRLSRIATQLTYGLPPSATTSAASSISTSTALLNGTVNPNGTSTSAWFRISSTNPGSCNDTFGTRVPTSGSTNIGSGTSSVAYSTTTTSLSQNTTYYYCAIASNGYGKGYGAIQSFTTTFVPVTTTITTNITTNQTWSLASSTYYIAANISVASGVTLTINPGVVVKFNGTSITVNGTLNAPGTATSSIYFTSYHDDTIGGDTNGNGSASSPAAGNWGGIITNTGASTTLQYAEVRYAGNSFFALFQNAGGVVTLANTTFATSGTTGVPAFDHKLGTTTITSCTFQNDYYGLYIENTSPTAGVITIASSTFSTGNAGIFSAGVNRLSIATSTFTQHSTYGLYTQGVPILSLTNSSFATNTQGAITFTNGNPASFTHSANKAWGNGMNGILIANPYIGVNQTWFGDTIPYVITGTLSIPIGSTLTIATSSVLKFNNGTVSVAGALKVASATATPVYFTSYKDDVLNDTNNDNASTTPAPGDWQNISVGIFAEFNGAVIRYAGSGGGAAVANSGLLTLINSEVASSSSSGIAANSGMTIVSTSTIHDNGSYGFSAQGGYATVTASTIKNHSTYGFVAGNNSGINLTMYGNTFSGNTQGAGLINVFYAPVFKHWDNVATGTGKGGVLLYGTAGTAQTWYGDLLLPYIISTSIGDLIVSKTVTVTEGAVIKFEGSSSRIYVGNGGAFNADSAASSSKIYLTSIKDDTVGGDTNGNGSANAPAAGDWDGLRVESGASSTLNFTVLRYGGNTVTGSSKMVWTNGGTVALNNSEVASSSNNGIYQTSGETSVQVCDVRGNNYGLYRASGRMSIGSSHIHGNSSYGAYSENNFFANNINAQYNYWGAASGPYNLILNPFGSGDAISSEVNFSPFLAQVNYLLVSNRDGGIISGVHNNFITYVATSTYMTALYAAVQTWNAQNKVVIATSTTPSLNDVLVFNIATTSDTVMVGQYNPLHYDNPSLNDTLTFNPYHMSGASDVVRQNVATHELGHALGLGHSYLGNMMNSYVTGTTTLGYQDILDLDTLW